jgi:rare lipoprotein A
MKKYFSILFLAFLFLSFSKPTFRVSKLKNSIDLQDTLVLNTKSFKKNVHASYYSDKLNGRKTASGEIFNNTKYTAAHKTLNFGTKLKVTNLANNKSVVVVVNDRGPFSKVREIDLSKKAFMEIATNKNQGQLLVNIAIITK